MHKIKCLITDINQRYFYCFIEYKYSNMKLWNPAVKNCHNDTGSNEPFILLFAMKSLYQLWNVIDESQEEIINLRCCYSPARRCSGEAIMKLRRIDWGICHSALKVIQSVSGNDGIKKFGRSWEKQKFQHCILIFFFRTDQDNQNSERKPISALKRKKMAKLVGKSKEADRHGVSEHSGPPGLLFHTFWASRSGDLHILCSAGTSWDGFWCSKIVKSSVGYLATVAKYVK